MKYSWPQPYIDAAQALLDDTVPRLIFSRAEAIELGLIQAEPVVIHMRGTSDQHLQASARSADEPLPTLTAGGTHVGLVLATSSGGAARDLEQPLPTITTGGAGSERPGCARPQLFEPIIVPMSNSSSAGVPRSVADPIRTVTTAKGGDQAMAVPLVAQYYGATATAQSVAEPVPSVTTKARFGLAEPFTMPVTHHGGERVRGMEEPLPTITGANRGELGLAQAAAELADQVVIDINYRMLHWRELARATSFDDEGEVYDFAGNATEITKQIGNAVPNRTAKALVMGLMRDAA